MSVMCYVDGQGKMCGVLEDLVSLLGEWCPRLVTYAGGASSLADLDRVSDVCFDGLTEKAAAGLLLQTERSRDCGFACDSMA